MFVATVLIVLGAAAVETPTDRFSAELDYLNTAPMDEATLVRTVRSYDVFQHALADWDMDLAETTALEGDADGAQAYQLRARQRYDTIQAAYKVLLAKYPRNASALNYYGEFLYDIRGEQVEALRLWKLSIAEDSKLPLPYNNLGIHYTHTGDYTQGLANLQKAIDLDPDNPDFKYNLAQIYLINFPQVQEAYKWDKKRVYQEAMKLSRRAAELSPWDYQLQQDYAVNFYAADNFEIEADWAEAAKAWQTARARARTNDELFFTWLNEGRVWLRKEDKAKAMACLEEARKIVPTSDVVQTLMDRARTAKPE